MASKLANLMISLYLRVFLWKEAALVPAFFFLWKKSDLSPTITTELEGTGLPYSTLLGCCHAAHGHTRPTWQRAVRQVNPARVGEGWREAQLRLIFFF
jgi:hypothetical protein